MAGSPTVREQLGACPSLLTFHCTRCRNGGGSIEHILPHRLRLTGFIATRASSLSRVSDWINLIVIAIILILVPRVPNDARSPSPFPS